MIKRIITALHGININPSVEELADFFWFIKQIEMDFAETKLDSISSTMDQKIDNTNKNLKSYELPQQAKQEQFKYNKGNFDTKYRPPDNNNFETEQKFKSKGKLYSKTQETKLNQKDVRQFRAPLVGFLSDKLEIGRALRPLKRWVESKNQYILNEDATVKRIAEERIWIPELQGIPLLKFSLVLIVEDSPSMVIWQPIVKELFNMLAHHGAFRHVKKWRIVSSSNGKNISFSSEQVNFSISHNLKISYDPTCHNIILVVSDCISRVWYTGVMGKLINSWGQKNSVAILQMLPGRLWSSTALSEAINININSQVPGATNKQFKNDNTDVFDDSMKSFSKLSIPVITLEYKSLNSWARVLTASSNLWIPGVVLDFDVSDKKVLAYNKKTEITPKERVQNYYGTASHTAQKLAIYLSTAPLTLPVIRLIQQVTLPKSRQIHLAEFFLGGLIKRVSKSWQGDPNLIEYDFHDGVREILQDSILSQEAENVLSAVSKYIEQRFGQCMDFQTLLSIDRTNERNKTIKAFAIIGSAVLNRLGVQKYKNAYKLNEKISKDMLKQEIDLSEIETKTEKNNIPPEKLCRLTGNILSKNDNLSLKEEYSFRINIENDTVTTFYFAVDINNNPIKIGDGTFGVVFKCHDIDMQFFAVKFFYEKLVHDESVSAPLNRFKFESDSSISIRKKLFTKNFQKYYTGLIEYKGGSDQFKSSIAYKTFNPLFKKLKMNISDYALVMPLYEWTLKGLLEKGRDIYSVSLPEANEANINKSLHHLADNYFSKEDIEKEINRIQIDPILREQIIKNSVYEVTGYDILKKMGFDRRINTMLPFLHDIAKGLRTLHLAERYHLDLTPANIFVKEKMGEVHSIIGNLGFIESQNLKTLFSARSESNLPFGTRHYRSPEQINYFNIYDAQLKHENDNVVLIIKDPNFKDTIIETGDIVIFSKDIHYKPYKISIIKFNYRKDVASVTLENNGNSLTKNLSEEHTQVFLFKNQSVRTDIFGFGAIIFNLLTCGNSAELFYQKIRHYDSSSESVDRIMQLYNQVSIHQSNQPGMVDTFKVFKDNHSLSFAPQEIVELILKCILYKAQKTYVNPNESTNYLAKQNCYKAIDAVIDDLWKLDEKYHSAHKQNALLDPSYIDPINISPPIFEENSFIRTIELLQEQKRIIPARFATGFWFLKQLVELVAKSLTKESKNAFFFSQMIPENIHIGPSSLYFLSIVYKTENQYKEDLIGDRVYTKITSNLSNPYVPDSLGFLRREITLEKLSDNKYRYRFLDSSIRGDYLQADDWVIIKNYLFKIEEPNVKKNEVSLKVDKFSPLLGDSENINNLIDPKKKYIYYAAIKPCKYYFEVLACYLYHIFFIGTEGSYETKPLIINNIFNYSYLNDDWNFLIGSQERIVHEYDSKYFDDADIQQKFKYIHVFISYMYLKLAFPKNKYSYYKSEDDNVSRVLAVLADIEELQKMIETFLGFKIGQLGIPIHQIEKEIENRKKDWSKYNLKPPNFQDNIDILTIQKKHNVGQKSFLNKTLSGINNQQKISYHGTLVHLFCNRDVQVNTFRKYFIQSMTESSEKFPQFYLIHGREDQGHSSLIKRLQVTIIQSYMKNKYNTTQAVYHTKSLWPDKKLDFLVRKEMLLYNLFNMFQDDLYVEKNYNLERLNQLEAIQRFTNNIIMISHNINASEWDKNLISWYMDSFWNTDNSTPEKMPHYIIFFNILYPQKLKKGFFFGNNSNIKRIKKDLRKIKFSKKCVLIDELMPISEYDVRNWFHKYQSDMNDHEIENKIYQMFKKSKYLSMFEVERYLNECINEVTPSIKSW